MEYSPVGVYMLSIQFKPLHQKQTNNKTDMLKAFISLIRKLKNSIMKAITVYAVDKPYK
jgi:hypothetical protein